MSIQTYLIDTNVIVGLEDHRTVQPAFAALLSVAAKHKVEIVVHEAARDDIHRDRDISRRTISLSKLEKFQVLKKVRGLERSELERKFGTLSRPNDVVDATLLDSVERGTADFLISERGQCRSQRAVPWHTFCEYRQLVSFKGQRSMLPGLDYTS
jgi:predicted nucleic acid-binding protein